MRGKDAETLWRRLDELRGLLDRVDRGLEKVEVVTLVREPDSGLAADAYNGLRKQVIAAVGERNAHLQQLAQFDAAVRGDSTGEQLELLVRGWLAQAGVVVVEDAAVAPEAFEIIGDTADGGLRTGRPAYVDEQTGRVIQRGLAERVPVEPEPEPDPVPVGGRQPAAEELR